MKQVSALQHLRDRLAELATAANQFDVFARASDNKLPAADVLAAAEQVAQLAEQVRLVQG